MKQILILVILISCLLIFISDQTISADNSTNDERPSIALVNRIVEIVERKSTGIDWRQAKIGDLLNSGDIIKTGPASFSLVRFYDNSLLRIRERSEVTVFADRDREHYHRNIQLDEGAIGFDVRKKETDRFEFSTPTSVASIRGSTGIIVVGPDEPDILLMVTGIAVFRNLLTNEEIEVTGGEIAFSFGDGRLEKRNVTEEDLETYGSPDDDNGTHGRERLQRTIEIRTFDEDGNPRTIIIEFEEDDIEDR
jgi:hypothetical protein